MINVKYRTESHRRSNTRIFSLDSDDFVPALFPLIIKKCPFFIFNFDKLIKIDLMKKKFCIFFLTTFLFMFLSSAYFIGCKSNQFPIYDKKTIELEDNIGFEILDPLKTDQANKMVKLNWILSPYDNQKEDMFLGLQDSWLLDTDDNLVKISVKTGKAKQLGNVKGGLSIIKVVRDLVLLLAQNQDNIVYVKAFSINSSQVVWEKSLEEEHKHFFVYEIKDEVLYITNPSNTFFAISIKDGKELWRLDLQNGARSRLFFYYQTIYLTDDLGTCYAIDQEKGNIIWKKHGVLQEKKTYHGDFDLFVSTGNIIGYYGNTYEPFIMVDKKTGDTIWEYPYSMIDIQAIAEADMKGNWDPNFGQIDWPKWLIMDHQKPLSINNKIYLMIKINHQMNLYVIDPLLKKVVWQKNDTVFCLQSDDKNIVIGREEEKNSFVVEKLNPENGEIIWSDKVPYRIGEYDEKQIFSHYIFMCDSYGDCYAVNTSNGKLVWQYSSNKGKANYGNLILVDLSFLIQDLYHDSLLCFTLLEE